MIIGHKDFKCETQKCSSGFVLDFHGNSSSNHGSVEEVIKGIRWGAGSVCVHELL